MAPSAAFIVFVLLADGIGPTVGISTNDSMGGRMSSYEVPKIRSAECPT